MELTKTRLTTTNLKAAKYIEFTVDDDFNVPDAKGDIERYIASKGQVYIEALDVFENRVRVSGFISYAILYQTDKKGDSFESHEGEIPYEETINLDGIMPGDKASVQGQLEDLYVTIINSRKYEVRGLVGMKVWACQQITAEGATGIANGNGIECLSQMVCFTNMVSSSRDMIKLKEEIELPSNKPNIGRVLWDHVTFEDLESRITDSGVSISGRMNIFVIYKPEDEAMPVSYVNATKGFQEMLFIDGVNEDMILDDIITIGRGQVTVRANDDGEDRILQVEHSINMDAKVYEDVEREVMMDMFSCSADVNPIKNTFAYENLLMRNNAKTRVTKKEKIKSSQPGILQVVNVSGSVDVDEVRPLGDSVTVDGAVKAAVLYVSLDDMRPLCQMEVVVPFTYKVETVPLKAQDSIRIIPMLSQISASLPGNDEVEIKAIVDMGITIFTRKELSLIEDMTIEPIDMKKKAAAPGIVGYVVKDGDSIWSIAKKYYSNLESIRKINELDSDEIHPGDKLVVVKTV